MTRRRGPKPNTSAGLRPPDWRDSAACLGMDPEMWFPIGTTGLAALQIEDARTVCRRCTVNVNCLQYALDTGQDAGIWGGKTEDERRAIKRRQWRKPRPSRAAQHGNGRLTQIDQAINGGTP